MSDMLRTTRDGARRTAVYPAVFMATIHGEAATGSLYECVCEGDRSGWFEGTMKPTAQAAAMYRTKLEDNQPDNDCDAVCRTRV